MNPHLDHHKKPLTREQLRRLRDAVKQGVTFSKLQARFGISKDVLRKLVPIKLRGYHRRAEL
jgi:hypothetical protein